MLLFPGSALGLSADDVAGVLQRVVVELVREPVHQSQYLVVVLLGEAAGLGERQECGGREGGGEEEGGREVAG